MKKLRNLKNKILGCSHDCAQINHMPSSLLLVQVRSRVSTFSVWLHKVMVNSRVHIVCTWLSCGALTPIIILWVISLKCLTQMALRQYSEQKRLHAMSIYLIKLSANSIHARPLESPHLKNFKWTTNNLTLLFINLKNQLVWIPNERPKQHREGLENL